ncbi:MAG: ATPase domain-containing protein [archaeon]
MEEKDDKTKLKKISRKKLRPSLVKVKKLRPILVKKEPYKRIKVGPQKISKNLVEERIPSGIRNLDPLIEGGIEKNSVNLLVGSSGTGKSIFSVQFLLEGIKNNENCLYITFEEKKKEVYMNMRDFGWDLEKLESQEKFLFLEYTPKKIKTMLDEGGGIIESIIFDKKIKRIVIDSISSFELLFDDGLKKRESSLSLFNLLRKWNCTSLLTYEGEALKGKEDVSKTLEFETDSIILLYFIRTNKERERFIEILKMRGTKHSRRIYPFSIEKRGIVISKHPCSKEIEKYI